MSGKQAKGIRAAGVSPPGVRRRTSRNRSLPEPPGDHTLDFADSRPELKGLTPGEVVLAIERLLGFKQVVMPVLDEIDRRRREALPGERGRRGQPFIYPAILYWRLELLRRVLGLLSTEATRDWLSTDKARATRQQLGLNVARVHFGGRARVLAAGIPSDGWMSDFRTKWLSKEKLAEMLGKLRCLALFEKVASVPGMPGELRTLFADGSKMEIHGTPPRYKKDKDGKYVLDKSGARVIANPDHVTAPAAGYIPNHGHNANHAGAGFNILFITTAKGTVVDCYRVPMHKSESEALCEMLDGLDEILTQVGPRTLRVLTTDGNFNSPEVRARLRAIGVLENIHLASHSGSPTSKSEAKKRDDRSYKIEGYEHWHANGHREIACDCDQGKVSRMITLNDKGRVIARLKGECETCGPITITSGRWRLDHNKGMFVKCPAAQRAKADFAFGNPLTYNDSLAHEHGAPRFPDQEGFFGSQLTQRFHILDGKRWIYDGTAADIDINAVITITHALSLERYRRMKASNAPPPVLAAAA